MGRSDIKNWWNKIMLLSKCMNEESVWGDKWRDVTELQNNSLIHKFKNIMQIIVVVVVAVVAVVVNLSILYCVPHTIFSQISHKMPSKNPIRKLGFILYWKITFILHQNQYVSAFRISLVNSAECILSMFLTYWTDYVNNNNGAWFGIYTTHIITPTEEKKRHQLKFWPLHSQ